MTSQNKKKPRKIIRLVQPEQVVDDQTIKEMKNAMANLKKGKYTGVAFVLTNKNGSTYTYFEGMDWAEICLGIKLLDRDFTDSWEKS